MRRGRHLCTWVSAVIVAIVAASASSRAYAEERPAHVVIGREARALGEQLMLRLDVFAWDDDREAIFDGPGVGYAADLHVDVRKRRAKVSLGAGDPGVVYLRIDARMWGERGRMRTSVVLKIGIAGERWQLTLPDVRMKAKVRGGELVYEFDVPLIEGRF